MYLVKLIFLTSKKNKGISKKTRGAIILGLREYI